MTVWITKLVACWLILNTTRILQHLIRTRTHARSTANGDRNSTAMTTSSLARLLSGQPPVSLPNGSNREDPTVPLLWHTCTTCITWDMYSPYATTETTERIWTKFSIWRIDHEKLQIRKSELDDLQKSMLKMSLWCWKSLGSKLICVPHSTFPISKTKA